MINLFIFYINVEFFLDIFIFFQNFNAMNHFDMLYQELWKFTTPIVIPTLQEQHNVNSMSSI